MRRECCPLSTGLEQIARAGRRHVAPSLTQPPAIALIGRVLDGLIEHGIGAIGPSVELHDARLLRREVAARLNPSPPTNLVDRYRELISRFPDDLVATAAKEADRP